MKKISVFLFLILLSGCAQDKVSLAVAANLSPLMPSLIEAFHKEYPDISVQYTLSSSGKLAVQILNGADFDIYLSADSTRPMELYAQGWGKVPPRVYALGRLIYIHPAPLEGRDLPALLRDQRLHYISIANPLTAPYGTAALEVLKNLAVAEISNKAVYAQNVAQAVQYVITAAVGGFIPLSALYQPALSNVVAQGGYIEIDRRLYTPIRQSALLLKNSGKDARLFYEFLFSDQARDVLVQGGYYYE